MDFKLIEKIKTKKLKIINYKCFDKQGSFNKLVISTSLLTTDANLGKWPGGDPALNYFTLNLFLECL